MATVIEHSRLKEYQGRLEKLKAEQAVILMRRKEVLNDEKEINKKINYIKQEIKGLTDGGLTMSEHAILRYIERVEVVHPNEVYDRVVTEELKKLYSILGNAEFPLGDSGHSCIVKNGVIVSIK